jgi:hypothetical protein
MSSIHFAGVVALSFRFFAFFVVPGCHVLFPLVWVCAFFDDLACDYSCFYCFVDQEFLYFLGSHIVIVRVHFFDIFEFLVELNCASVRAPFLRAHAVFLYLFALLPFIDCCLFPSRFRRWRGILAGLWSGRRSLVGGWCVLCLG